MKPTIIATSRLPTLPYSLPAGLFLAACLGASTLPSTVQAADASAEAEHGANPHAHHMMTMPDRHQAYQRSEARYRAPDVTLRDRQGRTMAMSELLAETRPIMLNFIFTSCTAVCPVMSATFAQVQSQLGEKRGDLRMVSISIDPEHDTPARLDEYAARFKADENWTFLTGRLADIVSLERAFGVYRGDKMNHSPSAFIRVAPGRPWVRIDGFTTAKVLIDEYRRERARLSEK